MAYRWKPSKSARREFAQNMQNADYAAAYYKRKDDRSAKRRSGSQFDYDSAGGNYVPTKAQSDAAFQFLCSGELTPQQRDACNMVTSAYACNEKIHHDYIHIVNELIRN